MRFQSGATPSKDANATVAKRATRHSTQWLYRLRKPDKWNACADQLWLSLPLRKVARNLGINLKTVFKWRHRLLQSHCQNKTSELLGIIEADEAFINESYKGRKDMHREPRRRGGGDPPKVPVLIALDRNEAVTHSVLERNTKEELSILLRKKCHCIPTMSIT